MEKECTFLVYFFASALEVKPQAGILLKAFLRSVLNVFRSVRHDQDVQIMLSEQRNVLEQSPSLGLGAVKTQPMRARKTQESAEISVSEMLVARPASRPEAQGPGPGRAAGTRICIQNSPTSRWGRPDCSSGSQTASKQTADTFAKYSVFRMADSQGT